MVELTTLEEIARWMQESAGVPSDAKLRVAPDATETFRAVLATLVARLGEPDFPGQPRGPERLPDAPTSLRAVWDFDYYLLTLRVENVDGEPTAILSRAHPAS